MPDLRLAPGNRNAKITLARKGRESNPFAGLENVFVIVSG